MAHKCRTLKAGGNGVVKLSGRNFFRVLSITKVDMVTCKTLSSAIYPNRKLCEWYVRKTGQAPQTLDTGETYVDLNNPLKPEIKRKEPDGEISPRELHGAVAKLLEGEWQKFLANKGPQPLAEELYRRFRFLPPWLPKPSSKMNPAERDLFKRFLMGILEIRYDPDRAIVEDNFLDILKAGVASCVGISNLFYFKEGIVKGRPARFIEVYRDNEGWQHPHFGVAIDERPEDPSHRRPLPQSYAWFFLDPMDQWGMSLMNTGLSKMDRDKISPAGFMENYGLRAYELAPDYFRVRFNLGVIYYKGGQKEIGVQFLQGASELYPSYHMLEEWKEVLTKD